MSERAYDIDLSADLREVGHPVGVAGNGHPHEVPARAPEIREAVARTKAVVLAGGRGTRLAPYTSVLPKPLMPIGDRAILEIVVAQLAACGITDVTFCVGYLSHLIRAVFDSRPTTGSEITYVHEETALGTAAPLRLIEGLDEPFILMNGDVLTTLNYADLVRHHRAHGNLLTVGTRERTIEIDYGVLHVTGSNGSTRVKAWQEKPEIVTTVSMGIYVADPAVIEFIPEQGYFDLPELVQALLAAGEPVGTYSFDGLWFDIGRHDDYAAAVEAWANVAEFDPRHRTDRRTQAPGDRRHAANGRA